MSNCEKCDIINEIEKAIEFSEFGQMLKATKNYEDFNRIVHELAGKISNKLSESFVIIDRAVIQYAVDNKEKIL